MAYPNAIDFQAANLNSAWWLVRRRVDQDQARAIVCQTDGYTFARRVQQVLQSRMGSGWTSWDNRPAGGRSLAIDSRFGQQTLRALWAYVNATAPAQDPTTANIKNIVRLAAGQRTIVPAVLIAAVWVLEHASPDRGTDDPLRWNDLSLPTQNLRPLRWSAASPQPAGWREYHGFSCRILQPWEVRPESWTNTLGESATTPQGGRAPATADRSVTAPPAPTPTPAPVPAPATGTSTTPAPVQDVSRLPVEQLRGSMTWVRPVAIAGGVLLASVLLGYGIHAVTRDS